jgi:hypothetical protein
MTLECSSESKQNVESDLKLEHHNDALDKESVPLIYE